MNPARSLAPAVFAGGSALVSLWIYFVGPALGALLGVFVYEVIRGSDENTKDVLEELPGTKEIASKMKEGGKAEKSSARTSPR